MIVQFSSWDLCIILLNLGWSHISLKWILYKLITWAHLWIYCESIHFSTAGRGSVSVSTRYCQCLCRPCYRVDVGNHMLLLEPWSSDVICVPVWVVLEDPSLCESFYHLHKVLHYRKDCGECFIYVRTNRGCSPFIAAWQSLLFVFCISTQDWCWTP